MSTDHKGNMLNEITFEEHAGALNAKRTSLVSAATIYAVVNTGAAGVGNSIVTVAIFPSSFGGNVTLDAGSFTGIKGNVTLSDPKGFIGLVTVGNNVNANVSLGASAQFIGIVTVTNKDRTITGNVTLSDSKGFIGLATVISRNAGTNKTLIHKTVAFAQASIVTIVVATNNFFITQLVLNSNATVRLNIKSGATYLTGNVSLGMSINPGGGWVESGSPDSPVYLSLSTVQAIVLEKFDFGGVLSQIGGKLIYYDE